MPRSARVVIPGIAHHITQRGNNRQTILVDETDFSRYCCWINQYAQIYKVSLLAYCLMSNHVHFIVVPEDEVGMSRLFNTVHMRYAQRINKKRETSGHLWQGRFFSCVMDEAHLYRAIRYVERNPVRADMEKYPWDYKWSSARRHAKKTGAGEIKIKDGAFLNVGSWKNYLMDADGEFEETIRKATWKGKAVAEEKFIRHWEGKMKCSLRHLKPGRRPKE